MIYWIIKYSNNDYINFVTKITINLNKMYVLIIMKDIIANQSIN